MSLPDGLYDLVLTQSLAARLSAQGEALQTTELGLDGADRLADALARQLALVLADLPGTESERSIQQVDIVNGLLVALRQRLAASAPSAEVIDLMAEPARLLSAVRRNATSAPEMGLAAPWLFTAGKGTPSLVNELRRELGSADQVDILVSFITLSGVRKLQDVFEQLTAVDARGRPAVQIRVLTTTYTGATEARALDRLAALPGCEVRVSLDGRRTRLHAKAWLFHRRSGFGSAYVGSANLSGAALSGGLEWTVKLTQRAQQNLFSRAAAHFETLWADSEFERYDPHSPEHRRALADALQRESFGGGSDDTLAPRFFDLRPKNYQQEMLDQLAAERSLGRKRSLVVAATGTGKTMVAAFDYRRTCSHVGGRPRLLFVAHREEILRQALRTYREVLRAPDFGELLAGGREPESHDHLFATIDSLTSRQLLERLGPGHWHSVVIDECHRLAAARFHAFASAVQPQLLLGLTATPERSDGQPIHHYFDARPDGAPAVELRLWHALDLQLLAPFEYYACDDATDFSSVPWDRAGETAALDQIVTGNEVRARLAVNEWQRLSADPRRSRALVFCVSVAHAEYMTAFLNRAGLPAACVVGSTAADERRKAPERLSKGELCALVTVDLYNEGVDLPDVDTLLLLRPTQSPVLFLQQIGRGLRLADGKESCLVLDFVGIHRTEFRFDRLLSGLTGLTRREVIEAVEQGFGSLPPGCHIHLQRQTRQQVLSSLRALAQQSWLRLCRELQAHRALKGQGPLRLAEFLHEQALDLEDVYRQPGTQGRSGWTALQRAAGLLVAEPAGLEEAYFSQRAGALLHFDDPHRLRTLAQLGRDKAQILTDEALRLQMLCYQIDGRHGPAQSYGSFLQRLDAHPLIGDEYRQLAELLMQRCSLPHTPLPGLEDTPLCLHASYTDREVLTAVGWLSATRRAPFQAGVLRLKDRRCELLFVTLDKSDGFHDRIAYHDYAISSDHFHWQSQNSAGPNTEAGRRYGVGAAAGWQFQLFVRCAKGQAYRACGPVTVASVEGDRPMSIVWQLGTPLPARLFRDFSVLRGL